MKVASEWSDKIPIGIIYRNDRKPFEEHFQVLKLGPLVSQVVDKEQIINIMEGYE